MAPDCKSMVINGKSGYKRDNTSWIVGRIIRDFDYWGDAKTKEKTAAVLDAKWKELQQKVPDINKPEAAGLVVTIYQPSNDTAMKPKLDALYWSGFPTAVIQMVIAAIPCGLSGDWGPLLITGTGIALALSTGLLGQWRKEKWACRANSEGTFVLTKGNGAQHAIVVLGNDKRGLNLEDLAAGQINLQVSPNKLTRIAIFIQAALWILLLITAAGLKSNTWYLLAVGGMGMVQNIIVAGYPRRPEHFGIPLDFVQVFGETKVMQTLFAVEEEYPHVGRSMRDEFFPGKLNADEIEKWNNLEKKAINIDEARREAEQAKKARKAAEQAK